MAHFIDPDRKTSYLLPPSMEDWLPKGHLARFIVEVIEQLDVSSLVKQYAGRSCKPYHPATLLAILVYGYANGLFSSRKLEQATYDSVAFRYLAAGSHPDHDMIKRNGCPRCPGIRSYWRQMVCKTKRLRIA